jgi:DNA-binding response OmpR family regulator
VAAPTGEDRFFRANSEVFDLVVLDLMLPGRDGLEILHAFRQRRIETPVLIRTQDEVNPVMSALLDNGIDVTALHNHFLWDERRMFYMHFTAMESPRISRAR